MPDDDPHRHRFIFTPDNGGTRIDQERWDPFSPAWPGYYPPLVTGWARMVSEVMV